MGGGGGGKKGKVEVPWDIGAFTRLPRNAPSGVEIVHCIKCSLQIESNDRGNNYSMLRLDHPLDGNVRITNAAIYHSTLSLGVMFY